MRKSTETKLAVTEGNPGVIRGHVGGCMLHRGVRVCVHGTAVLVPSSGAATEPPQRARYEYGLAYAQLEHRLTEWLAA